MTILERVKTRRLYFDGGTGSLLQKQGLPAGMAPEERSISHPAEITALHAAYLEAGADIIKTNTFGINPLKYENYTDYLHAAFACAKRAVEQAGHGYVALDVGPLGRMLEPFGDLPFERAVEAFSAVVREGAKEQPDLILIETMNDSYETKAALLAAKEQSDLPVFVTNAYDAGGTLMTGADPLAMIAMLEGLGADAIGINCSVGPAGMLPLVRTYAHYASVPIIVNPNAGLPSVRDGRTVYDVAPQAFADTMAEIARAGGCILGGCCGTTPEYIARLRERTEQIPYVYPKPKTHTLVSSYTHAVCFDGDPVLIGERINPTGKKLVKQALEQRDYSYILQEGLRQADVAGVQMLDCNAGVPGIDEAEVLSQVIARLQTVTDLPLQIDSTLPAAIERSARIYNGKPLINSVNGSQQSMNAVLPIVKKYGGAVIALTMDEDGIPESADGRFAIARRIVERAAEYGIDRKNIIADPLAMTISAGQQSARIALETVERITAELGIATTMGVSNISFGLPARDPINAAFFTLALGKGLSSAIVNPFSEPLMQAYRAYRALTAYDRECMDYIAALDEGERPPVPEKGQTLSLADAIERGMSDAAEQSAHAMLQNCQPLELINREVVPALNRVGEAFEQKRAFLPQLLMSADAASRAFAVIREHMPPTEGDGDRVVLATVKGDIHDIGKNIVKALLENFGFSVIDLGRDVPPERVVEAARGCSLVGLSALMTTTVPAMEKTIHLLHAAYPGIQVVVGGAVLTQEYADSIGADYYSKDAMETVRIAQKIFGKG